METQDRSHLRLPIEAEKSRAEIRQPLAPVSEGSIGIDLLAHRGLWTHGKVGNSLPALQAALEAGYGLETDIRDYQGEIVIAHDPPSGPMPMLAELLAIYGKLGSRACLALNVKSCGLASKLTSLIAEYKLRNYYLFDMAIPDALAYDFAGLRFYTRQSEYEREPALYKQAAGVWLDAFHGCWFDQRIIEKHLEAGKDVCVVSPELHRRDPKEVWDMLKRLHVPGPARLMICSDHPDQITST